MNDVMRGSGARPVKEILVQFLVPSSHFITTLFLLQGECIERCKELFEAVKRRKHTS